MLEIYRQGIRLPLQHAEVIKKVISMTQKMFLSNLDSDGNIGDKLFEHQEVIIHLLKSLVFFWLLLSFLCLFYID